ncbi:MAG TPA: hypothetical protein VKB55_01330, partial [Nocardioidaceae bacterium]|nr:hypothetical protein [Nocardioidaceae bacterium]
QVDLSGTNKLSATCESDEAQTQVHLQFEVNGGPVVEATDKNPTGNGTVGLFVNGEEASSPAEVQFDNFVVTRA